VTRADGGGLDDNVDGSVAYDEGLMKMASDRRRMIADTASATTDRPRVEWCTGSAMSDRARAVACTPGMMCDRPRASLEAVEGADAGGQPLA
jgi:hypothetical protein